MINVVHHVHVRRVFFKLFPNLQNLKSNIETYIVTTEFKLYIIGNVKNIIVKQTHSTKYVDLYEH